MEDPKADAPAAEGQPAIAMTGAIFTPTCVKCKYCDQTIYTWPTEGAPVHYASLWTWFETIGQQGLFAAYRVHAWACQQLYQKVYHQH